MDLANNMTTDETGELHDRLLAWIDRRPLDARAERSICAIDDFREMARQIEGSLCRRR